VAVPQRLLEAVRVGEEADLARSLLAARQQVDLAVADETAEPRVPDDHVGDHRERRVTRVLVDHASGLDHPTRRHDVPLDAPHEIEPADAEDPDRQEDPEAPVEQRREEARHAVVVELLAEDEEHDAAAEREDEPPPRLEERQPVTLADEHHPLARGEQGGEASGRILGCGARVAGLDGV